MNVNGTIMPVQNTGNVTIIASNTTIANSDVYNNVVVLSGATLTIYGNVVFHGSVTVLNGATLQSSNPSASSSSTQTNNYQFLGGFYLNGTYSNAQYNVDNVNTSVALSTVTSEGGANPTMAINGTLYYKGISVSSGGTSDPGLPSFPVALAGSGIGIFTTTNSSGGGNSYSMNNQSIAAGSNNGAGVSSSGIIPYTVLTSLEGSAAGKYAVGSLSGGDYYPEALIYIGTANTAYSVSFTIVNGSANATGQTGSFYNSSSSAGTITVSGTYHN
jgi:hypothetical protein